MEQNPTKKCPKCQKEVDLKATKCPYCQSDMRRLITRHPLLIVLFVVVIFPMFVSFFITDAYIPGPAPKQDIKETKYEDAGILAKLYIKKIPLKSPSTAKYNPPTTKVDPKNPNLYEVSSYIDSQNGFGAMIRTYWSIKLEYTGEDNENAVDSESNWKIREFIFDGNKIK